jgi:hypothetical protein
MVQYRNDHPERKRKIKRETKVKDVDIKGVAGLRIQEKIGDSSKSEDCKIDLSSLLTKINLNDES